MPMDYKRREEIIAAWDRDEIAVILDALSAVDEEDLDYLISRLGDSGKDAYCKGVLRKLRPVFNLEICSQ